MTAENGYGGDVTWVGTKHSDFTKNVRSWTIDYTADSLDTTDFSSTGDRTFIGGLRTWSGTYECLLDGATAPLSDSANVGAVITGTDIITITAASGRTYTGDAIVSGIHPSVSVDGVNVITYDFQGTGALTTA